MSAPLADGIYFGLPDDQYHADPALGSSDLKAIYIDPVDWQFDRLQGEDVETDALLLGRALHCRVLEGRAAFEARYCAELPGEPDALRTVEELQKWLVDRGLPKSGKKEDLIARIRDSGAAQPKIWQEMLEEHAAANAGKEELTAKQWLKVQTAAEWMQADQTLAASMEDGTFRHGAPEVSVFYTEGDVRLKARFDYLIGHAIIDLKSFSTMFKEVPGKSITRAIVRQRYDLQAAAYVRAWHKGRELFKAGKVFGDAPDQLLERVYSRPHPLWIWTFLKSTGAPQPYVRPISHEEMVFSIATEQVNRAINTYREKVETHGAETIWPPCNPPDPLTTDDFPQWFQD